MRYLRTLAMAGLVLSLSTYTTAEEPTAGVFRITDLNQGRTVAPVAYGSVSTSQPAILGTSAANHTGCNSCGPSAALGFHQDGGSGEAAANGDAGSNKATVPLYHWVEYKDVEEAHPCGVPTVVWVPDPCFVDCSCSRKHLVPIEICVPPCARPTVLIRKGGRDITYKYGKNEVDIRVRGHKGKIIVDYQNSDFLGLF